MRWLLSLLLSWPMALFGAAGDITGVEVEASGWVLKVTVSTINTNGTFAWGLTTNAITGSESVRLTVTAPGFDDEGSSNNITRTVYGTKQLRFPYSYGGQTALNYVNDVVASGGDAVIRLALSDFLYAGETATYSIAANWYTADATPNNSGSGSATISSIQPYPSVIGNWSYRGFRVIDDETNLVLRAVAYHAYGQQGRPVRMAEFTVTDSSAATFTNRQTVMRIDRGMGDANPIPEFIASFSTNSLAAGLLVCNVKFFPWVGTNVLDSAATGYVEPTPYLCTLTNAFGIPRVRAIVANDGNDTTGVAATPAAWASSTNIAHLLTIGQAMKRIYDTNAVLGVSGWGGGIIYLADGNYGWFGSSVSLVNAPSAELLIQPWTAGSTAVYITNRVTDQIALSYKDIWRIKGVDIASTNITFQFALQGWLDRCNLHDCSGGQLIDSDTTPNSYVMTQCTVSNIVQGLRCQTLDNGPWSLFRGNFFKNGITNFNWYTFVGNDRRPDAAQPLAVTYDVTSQNAPKSGQSILAYNSFYLGTGGSQISIGVNNAVTNGAAVVNNLFATGDTTEATLLDAGQGAIAITNLLFWNNTVSGSRVNYGYNDVGTSTVYKWGWSNRNNIFDALAYKTDLWGTPSINRTGNWSVGWCVMAKGNVYGQNTNAYSASIPLTSYVIASQVPDNPANLGTNWWKPVAMAASDGKSINPVPGNMRLATESPLQRWVETDWILPFDLDGNHRGLSDPPGAYSSSNPRRAAGFFAP